MGNHKTKTLMDAKVSEGRAEGDYFDFSSTIFVMIDRNGIVRNINKKGVKVLGGKNEHDIIGRNWFDYFVPSENREKLYAEFKNMVKENDSLLEYVENSVKTMKGSLKAIAWNNSVFNDANGNFDHVISFGREIAGKLSDSSKLDLKKRVAEKDKELVEEGGKKEKALELLKRSEEKYKSLVNNANESVLLFDKEGNLAFANDKFLKYSRKNNKTGRPFHFTEYVAHGDIKKIEKVFLKLLNGRISKYNGEFRAKNISGRYSYVNFSATAFKDDLGNVTGVQVIARDTTSEKRLSQELENSKLHYEEVINTIEDGICVIDKDYNILSFNNAFRDELDIAKNEPIKGENYKKIISHYKKGAVSGYCCPKCENGACVLNGIFTTGERKSFEVESKDAGGKRYFHRITFLPSINKKGDVYQLVVSFRDITQRKIAEEAVRRLNAFNQKILDNAPVSILVLDGNGLIISANKLAAALMKKNIHEVIGRKLVETPTIEANKKMVKGYELLLKKGERLYFDNLRYTAEKDNSTKYLNILAVPLYGRGGKIEGAISMAMDNTEAMQAKNRLSDLNRELEQKVLDRTKELNRINKRLGIMLDLKSKFVADASHELRTPLTVIQGNLDLAIREAEYDKKEVPEIYEIIMYEVSRMRNILTDLTMLTNVDSRSEVLTYEKIYIKHLVKAVTQSMGVLARQKGILLMCQKRLDNIYLMGDEAKLEKLLLNIVRNAIKYTNEGGRVKICVARENNNILLSVEDTGLGIPDDEIEFIFERFYRVDQSRNSSEGGTGLGLSIAKWIAESHGGKIEVKSRLGVGSKFTITLPVDPKKSEE
jgi:PAS domain S-box-containing protein